MGLIEVLIATLVLTIGTLGVIGGFTSSRKLDLLSERRTSIAHRAQLEIERLQGLSYKELAMSSAPTHSTVETNPDYYVKEGGTEYQYGSSTTETEKLVESKTGVISNSPTGRQCSESVGACEWKDGNVSGSVYDFVTTYTEADKLSCEGEKCPKRITVVATANVPTGNQPVKPIRVSTLIVEP